MSSIAGSILSGLGMMFEGFSANQAAKDRARQLRAGADQISMEAGVNAQAYMQDSARAEATGFVTAAASGGFGGSALDVLNDFSSTALFNARSLVYRGQTEARNRLYEANVARADGKRALIRSAFGAAGSILGSMGKGQGGSSASAEEAAAAAG